jgi:hypothetical protein
VSHSQYIANSWRPRLPSCACSNFEEVDDATDDPEPIMVTEAEEDDALAAILDENIGISSNGWDCTLQRRCTSEYHLK